MPRHKRRTRFPNRYGSISYLGKGRRRPYAVYPPATQYTDDGRTIRPKALGYTATYNEAMELLVMYNRGLELPDAHLIRKKGPTFAEIYQLYYDDKYTNSAKPMSKSSMNSTKKAYQDVGHLHDRDFASLTYADLQGAIDSCPLGHASLEFIKVLLHGMYHYAVKYEIVDKDPSQHLEIRIPDDDEHGVPFTDEELALMWSHADNPDVQLILVMVYTGFRIRAYKTIDIHLSPDWYLQGGIKTAASKNRIVPIHSAIQPFIAPLLVSPKAVMQKSYTAISNHMRKGLVFLGIDASHTPHDCRHTFSYLLEKYGVPENDRKRLLGHAFQDITNSVYGHRSLEQLRASIEMIKIPQ